MALNTIDVTGILRGKEVSWCYLYATTRKEPVFSIIISLNLHSSPLVYVRDWMCPAPPLNSYVEALTHRAVLEKSSRLNEVMGRGPDPYKKRHQGAYFLSLCANIKGRPGELKAASYKPERGLSSVPKFVGSLIWDFPTSIIVRK